MPRSPSVFLAVNDDKRSEMIDSVRIGLATWRQRVTIGERDGFLVCPGDHPGIPTPDFNACIAAFESSPDCIIVATHAGRRGHPLIFPAALVGFVESSACDGGLRALPEQHAGRVLPVECESNAAVRDVDTPDDLHRLGR